MMERNSVFYKIRRKGQVLAHALLPDELMCKLYSRIILKKSVNLSSPKTFNEKIQWLKIHDYPTNDLVIQGADKFAVRKYVESKGLGNVLVPLIGYWDTTEKIIWNDLPMQFVLKCNHGCAYNIVCSNKDKLDRTATLKQINQWMKEDFGAYNIELHYSRIKPHMITCEEYLGDCITDYKFFCFNGEPKYIYISDDLIHDRQAHIGFYYLNGEKMPLIRDDYAPKNIDKFPTFFNEMLASAKILCADFQFVRVDFFVTDQKYYFAELTFTPSAGMMPFNPDLFDLEWGKELSLENRGGTK